MLHREQKERERMNNLKENSLKIKLMVSELETIYDTLENNSHSTCDKFSNKHRTILMQLEEDLRGLINRQCYLDNLRTFAEEIVGVGSPNVEREVA